MHSQHWPDEQWAGHGAEFDVRGEWGAHERTELYGDGDQHDERWRFEQYEWRGNEVH